MSNFNNFARDIYLIRHGQYHTKEKEAEKKILTELGREQAILTGKFLNEMGLEPDEFIHSVRKKLIFQCDRYKGSPYYS